MWIRFGGLDLRHAQEAGDIDSREGVGETSVTIGRRSAHDRGGLFGARRRGVPAEKTG
jgi:hypothetical protein